SAICPQGLSSKFTQPPKVYIDGRYYEGRAARLMIFAQAEGLGVWEERRKGAVKAAGVIETQAAMLERQAASGVTAVGSLNAARTGRQRAEFDVESSARQIGDVEGILAGVRRDLQTLTSRIAETTATAEAYRAEVATLADDEVQLSAKQTKASRYREILAHRTEIEAKAAESETLKAQAETAGQELAGIEAQIESLTAQQAPAQDRLRILRTRVATLNDRLLETRRRLTARGTLEGAVKQLQSARADRETRAVALHALDEQLTATQARRDEVSRSHVTAEQDRGRILGEEKRIQAETAGLLPLIRGHESRVAVLGTVPCIGVGDLQGRCPLLADAHLSEGQLVALRPKLLTLQAWTRPPLPELEPTGRLDAELLGLRQKKAQEQEALKALEEAISRLTPAEADLASLTVLAEELPKTEEDLRVAGVDESILVRSLGEMGGGLEAGRKRAGEVQKHLADLDESLAALARWASVLPELAIAEVEMAVLVPEIARLEERIAGLRERSGLAVKMAAAVRADQAALQTLQAEEQGHVLDLASLRQAERTAAQTLADATAEIRRLEAVGAEAEKATAEAKSLRTRHATLTTLALAYKQIPIMILETQAVPQVELEANRILTKISRNGMRTELRTLREVKSRDELADGLDIIITDRRGQRSYEDYSGGQKFQVDLAYRVALSRRQSHRSGGGIGCLFLDEGFGTQDTASLEGVIQTLRDLSGEIPQLLITSHVEALKETFPVRIEVSGGPEASAVEVVGA
ncbi:MAG TPA: SMC family ATPase, partial [Anaerolineales bacterium]|nr:SMC family ATPase [Anaerolineales bacterium]